MMFFSKEFLESSVYAYDLRSKDFLSKDAFLLGKAFGSELNLLNKDSVCVGYDRRNLSRKLHDSFTEGLVSVGINVFSLGRIGTPVIQYMAVQMNIDSAVSITASHNPIGYHGFKFFVDNTAFSGVSLRKLIIRCIGKQFDCFNRGRFENINFIPYLKMLSSIEISGKFSVGWDLLNGCGGDVFSSLKLSGNNIVLNQEFKEDFNGYAPDPNCIERLSEIIGLLSNNKIDFAFLIDGDADRTSLLYKGRIVQGDTFLSMLIYLEYLIFNKKTTVVWDDISSLCLKKWTAQFSENFISKTGHSNVQKLAIEKDAFVAGEMSGHYMFKNMYYIDDGIYTSLKFISYLEKSTLSLDELLEIVPKTFIKKCDSVYCSDYFDKHAKISVLKEYLKKHSIYFAEFDGLKIFLESGCLIVRPSNTEPIIRVLAEGWSQDGLDEVIFFLERIRKALSL